MEYYWLSCHWERFFYYPRSQQSLLHSCLVSLFFSQNHLTYLGPATRLLATSLAKRWISESTGTSLHPTSFLPSTPQYLLALGNLGIPSFHSLWKSWNYYRSRQIRLSPVFTVSVWLLCFMIVSAVAAVAANVWIHLGSDVEVGEPLWDLDRNLGNFSRSFSPSPSSQTDILGGGLQTLLGLSTSTTVMRVNNSTILVPTAIPNDISVEALTIGLSLDCNLVNLDCTFDDSSSPLTFSCPSISPSANGPLGDVNIIFYFPSTTNMSNATSFSLLASMALQSPFNSSTVLAAQVFQCSGSLQNLTYTFVSGQFNVTSSRVIGVQPLLDTWSALNIQLSDNSQSIAVAQSILNAVGLSTLSIQNDDISTTPSVFTDGLSRFFVSFLSFQTSPSVSLKVFPLPVSLTNMSNQPHFNPLQKSLWLPLSSWP